MFRRALAGSSAALALFHVWLFSGQALAGELADPGLLVRWLAAFGIVGGLILLRRRGQSLRGRKAVAIWLLAALLHGPAVANQIGTTGLPAVPDLAAVLVQLAVASAAAVILHLLVRWPRAKAQRPSRRPAVGLVCWWLAGRCSLGRRFSPHHPSTSSALVISHFFVLKDLRRQRSAWRREIAVRR